MHSGCLAEGATDSLEGFGHCRKASTDMNHITMSMVDRAQKPSFSIKAHYTF